MRDSSGILLCSDRAIKDTANSPTRRFDEAVIAQKQKTLTLLQGF